MDPKLEEQITNGDLIKQPRSTWPTIDPNKTLIAAPIRLHIAITAMSGYVAHPTIGMLDPCEIARWSLMQADALIEQYNTGKTFTIEEEEGVELDERL